MDDVIKVIDISKLIAGGPSSGVMLLSGKPGKQPLRVCGGLIPDLIGF